MLPAGLTLGAGGSTYSDRPNLAVPRGFGVTRVMSRDVRYGHPCPSLTRRNLRFALRAALAFYAADRGTGDPEP
jgi:hypothetical protein